MLNMKKIILDTNFLTIPVQFNLDIFEEIDRIIEEEYELATTDGVIEELEKLAKSKGKDAIAARVGLELVKKKNIRIIKTSEKNTDEYILKISDKNTIVATNDQVLKQRLKHKNVKTIYLRSKKYLEIS